MNTLELWTPVSTLYHRIISVFTGPVKTITCLGSIIVSHTIVRPLTNLYLNGPKLLGFWGGLDPEDICHQLTDSPSRYFVDADGGVTPQCQEMIHVRFQFWLVLLYTASYWYFLLLLLKTVWNFMFRRRPPAAAS